MHTPYMAFYFFHPQLLILLRTMHFSSSYSNSLCIISIINNTIYYYQRTSRRYFTVISFSIIRTDKLIIKAEIIFCICNSIIGFYSITRFPEGSAGMDEGTVLTMHNIMQPCSVRLVVTSICKSTRDLNG
jgi:hypothetical protein